MGTSSARRGPTTPLWRAAKAAATRYLSPEAGGEVSAREVVARYLAALEETSGEGGARGLAAFRFTRKVGQDLGDFWQQVNSSGWDAALNERGLGPLAAGPPEALAQGLSGVLAGSGGGLEVAVVRTALTLVVQKARQPAGSTDSAQVVRQFLATALHLRLALDLGEPLEAAAGSYNSLKDGLYRIEEWIDANLEAAPGPVEASATSGHWRGLPGWTWVTETMAGLLTALNSPAAGK